MTSKPTPHLIETSAEELDRLYTLTVEAEHVILTVNRVADFMRSAIDSGFATISEVTPVLELIALATDPQPSLVAEKAVALANELRRREGTKPEGKP